MAADNCMMDEVIQVAIRKRPCRRREEDIIGTSLSNKVTATENSFTVTGSPSVEKHYFDFDYIFDEYTTNRQIFDSNIQTNLEAAVRGKNFCCMAYGETGSGKTYTMFGYESLGIVHLSATYLYKQSCLEGKTVRLSCIEIYQNKIYDIFNDRKQLKIYSKNDRFQIPGLQYIKPDSSADFLDIIKIARSKRRSGVSSENERSSRSHAIFMIDVMNGKKLVSSSTFIDLAGNERASQAIRKSKVKMRENAEINTSLLALKECIRIMCENIRDKPKVKGKPPFRNSVLTKAIRKMFVVEGRALLIGTVSPEESNMIDTLDTLRYVSNVKFLIKEPTRLPDIIQRAPKVKTEELLTEITIERPKSVSLRSSPIELLHSLPLPPASPIPIKRSIRTKKLVKRNINAKGIQQQIEKMAVELPSISFHLAKYNESGVKGEYAALIKSLLDQRKKLDYITDQIIEK